MQVVGRSARQLDRRPVVHWPLDGHLDARHRDRVRPWARGATVVVMIGGVGHVPLVTRRVPSHPVPVIPEDDAGLHGTTAAVDGMVPILLRTPGAAISVHDAQ